MENFRTTLIVLLIVTEGVKSTSNVDIRFAGVSSTSSLSAGVLNDPDMDSDTLNASLSDVFFSHD